MITTLIILFLYFLPSILAASRGHPNVGAIVVINTFLGWTFIGWVVSLAWSLTNKG